MRNLRLPCIQRLEMSRNSKSAPGRFGGYQPSGRRLRRSLPPREAPREVIKREFGRNGQMRGRLQSCTPADYAKIRDAIDSGREAAVGVANP